MVSSMASYTDVSKAHEVANEVRRLQRQLLEAQQNALLYNSRERLFDMPITNVGSSRLTAFFSRITESTCTFLGISV